MNDTTNTEDNTDKEIKLDNVAPSITERVIGLRRNVHRQGDPLLVLRLDGIYFEDSAEGKMKILTETIQDVVWRT